MFSTKLMFIVAFGLFAFHLGCAGDDSSNVPTSCQYPCQPLTPPYLALPPPPPKSKSKGKCPPTSVVPCCQNQYAPPYPNTYAPPYPNTYPPPYPNTYSGGGGYVPVVNLSTSTSFPIFVSIIIMLLASSAVFIYSA